MHSTRITALFDASKLRHTRLMTSRGAFNCCANYFQSFLGEHDATPVGRVVRVGLAPRGALGFDLSAFVQSLIYCLDWKAVDKLSAKVEAV